MNTIAVADTTRGTRYPVFKRRHIVGTLAALLAILARPNLTCFAKELRGKWTKEWMVKYSISLVEWAKEDLQNRSDLLKTLAEIDVPLRFKHFHGTLDRKDQMYQDRFLAAKLSDQDTADHTLKYLRDVEEVRVLVAAKESEAAPKWKNDQLGETPVKNGMIFDSSISSRRLGVILDKSRSMTPYLESLRTEIDRDFTGCHVVEVDGCEMREGGGGFAWFYADRALGINPFTADRHCPGIPQSEAHRTWASWTRDTQSAFHAMLTLMNVDAIYWFCDFDDPIADVEVQKTGKLLLEKKVKLFVHTLSKPPPNLVRTLVERSAGKLIKKRMS